jgi:hypothetical protein
MNPDEMIRLLRSMKVAHEVAHAVADAEAQRAHGWDLSRWTCEDSPRVVRLLHHDREGRPTTALLCVDAAEDCPWVYEAALGLLPYTTRLLALETGGERHPPVASTPAAPPR